MQSSLKNLFYRDKKIFKCQTTSQNQFIEYRSNRVISLILVLKYIQDQ